MNGVVRLTRSGPVVSGSDEELSRLRAHFEGRHYLALPGFLDPALLDTLRAKLKASDFARIDRAVGSELRPLDSAPYFALELLLNSRRVLELIPRLTGCPPVACFTGRIYRRAPGESHVSRWHTDLNEDGRMVTLSLNLSDELYRGGTTLLREAATGRVVCELPNTGFGDAILFPIDPRFEHRVLDVEGDAPKTALAGWFNSKPDPRHLFTRGAAGANSPPPSSA
ncbi:MAG: 2OG-Fe(II) oxygenase [Acidobacteria bacterium]|nr:2OG-Fe(II) oxygenase [Acidobacteriota bacterium]